MLHLTLSTPDKCAKQEVRFRLRTFLWLDSLLLTSSMRHPKCLTSFSKSKSGWIIFCSSVRNNVLLAVPATPSVLMSMLMMVLAMSITLSTISLKRPLLLSTTATLTEPERFFFFRTNMLQRYTKKCLRHPNHPKI